MSQRTKPRITVTIDPDMLEEVDTYIQEHTGTDRSQVVGEALRCWYSLVLHEALIRQHSAPKSVEELEEHEAWRRVRAAQIERLGRKYRS